MCKVTLCFVISVTVINRDINLADTVLVSCVTTEFYPAFYSFYDRWSYNRTFRLFQGDFEVAYKFRSLNAVKVFRINCN